MIDPARLFQLRVRLSEGTATITAWDANHTNPKTGHMRIDCQLTWRPMNGGISDKSNRPIVVFPRGATWCAVNRYTAIDGIEAKERVMSLFAMRPGDTDAEFFEHYTDDQLSWVTRYGEELGAEREARYCDENGNVKAS